MRVPAEVFKLVPLGMTEGQGYAPGMYFEEGGPLCRAIATNGSTLVECTWPESRTDPVEPAVFAVFEPVVLVSGEFIVNEPFTVAAQENVGWLRVTPAVGEIPDFNRVLQYVFPASEMMQVDLSSHFRMDVALCSKLFSRLQEMGCESIQGAAPHGDGPVRFWTQARARCGTLIKIRAILQTCPVPNAAGAEASEFRVGPPPGPRPFRVVLPPAPIVKGAKGIHGLPAKPGTVAPDPNRPRIAVVNLIEVVGGGRFLKLREKGTCKIYVLPLDRVYAEDVPYVKTLVNQAKSVRHSGELEWEDGGEVKQLGVALPMPPQHGENDGS